MFIAAWIPSYKASTAQPKRVADSQVYCCLFSLCHSWPQYQTRLRIPFYKLQDATGVYAKSKWMLSASTSVDTNRVIVTGINLQLHRHQMPLIEVAFWRLNFLLIRSIKPEFPQIADFWPVFAHTGCRCNHPFQRQRRRFGRQKYWFSTNFSSFSGYPGIKPPKQQNPYWYEKADFRFLL